MTDRSQSRLSHQQPPYRLRLGGPSVSDWSLCFGSLTLFHKKNNIWVMGLLIRRPPVARFIGSVLFFSVAVKGNNVKLSRLARTRRPRATGEKSVCLLCKAAGLTLENTTATHNPSLTDCLTKQRQEHKNGAQCCKKK